MHMSTRRSVAPIHPRTRLAASACVASLMLLLAACGNDDGEEVRGEVEFLNEDGTETELTSAASSASASASAPAGADAATSSIGDGGYEYASNVEAHRLVVADICPLGELLDDGDFAAVEAIYRNGGNSVNSDGSVRTIGDFASADDRLHGYDDYFDAPTPLDDFVTDALRGTGMFEDQPDAVRAQGVEKGIQNQTMVAWVRHELASALAKAEAGDFDVADGAVHNWDEAWAFYHGAEPGCGPYATGNSRAANFGTVGADGVTAQANERILASMIEGRDALVAGDADTAARAAADVTRELVVIYGQATIRYASLIEQDIAEDDAAAAKEHQVEGLAFFRVIEPDIAAAGGDVDAVNAILDLANEPGANGFGDEVRAALAPAFDELGISDADLGELE